MWKLGSVALLVALATQSVTAHKDGENYFEARQRLKRDLFTNYDKDLLPQMDKNTPVNVSAGLSVLSMDMQPDGLLNMVAWFRSMWHDARLAWDPKSYQGIKQLRISAKQLWVPDLQVYNAEDYSDSSFSNTVVGNGRVHNAVLMADGTVLYIPPTKILVFCGDETNFADWPWGAYDCNMKIGPWTYSGEQLNLKTFNGVNFIEMEKDGRKVSPMVFSEGSFEDEEVVKSKLYDCCPEQYQSIEFKFKVQRQFRMSEDGMERNPNPVSLYESPEGANFW